jgi:hypothetical protein
MKSSTSSKKKKYIHSTEKNEKNVTTIQQAKKQIADLFEKSKNTGTKIQTPKNQKSLKKKIKKSHRKPMSLEEDLQLINEKRNNIVNGLKIYTSKELKLNGTLFY